MNTARTSSATDRATLTAWMTARLTPGIGTTARSSRCGVANTMSSRTWSSRRDASYWRWMKSIIPTISGMRMTTSYAPSANFTVVTTARTTAVRTAPTPLIDARYHQPRLAMAAASAGPCPTWERVKHTNTPTE